MTAVMPARTGVDDLPHRLELTLTHADAVTVALGLAPGAGTSERREALLVLAAAEEDLHSDGLTAELHEAVAVLAPHLPRNARDEAWQYVCEAAALIPEWLDEAGNAWLLAVDGLPSNKDPRPTVTQAVDGLEDRRDDALDRLLGTPSMGRPAPPAVPDAGEKVDGPPVSIPNQPKPPKKGGQS